MALLKSTDIPLGGPAPDFKLPSVDGKVYALKDFSAAKALVVMFICNHCPYVQAVEDRILKLHRDYKDKGVQVVGICSNDPTDYPDDSPANLLKRWKQKEYGFPYLIDESQAVAKAFGAVCTPDIYVYDAARRLAYHGRIDDNWQHPDQVAKQELRAALDALLAGKPPAGEQWPSMGCSIKWKKS
ncbi:MAG: thioredoxin family protein [Candidatus Binatia bacterium]